MLDEVSHSGAETSCLCERVFVCLFLKHCHHACFLQDFTEIFLLIPSSSQRGIMTPLRLGLRAIALMHALLTFYRFRNHSFICPRAWLCLITHCCSKQSLPPCSTHQKSRRPNPPTAHITEQSNSFKMLTRLFPELWHDLNQAVWFLQRAKVS